MAWLEWLRDTGHSFFGPLVAVGEVVIGICLILGLFTGIMAFLGAILNFLFVLAGSAGVNPAMIVVSMFLILAWRNAGWYGLDQFVLPASAPLAPGRAAQLQRGQGIPGDDHLTHPPATRRTPRHPPGSFGIRPRPTGPETAGRSAAAAAGQMGEAQLGGMRPPADRGGDNHDRDAVPFDQPRLPARDRR